jgi:hypothetical protein
MQLKVKKLWSTNLTGTYHPDELSFLYSPCFDLTGLVPALIYLLPFNMISKPDMIMPGLNTGRKEIPNWIKLGVQGEEQTGITMHPIDGMALNNAGLLQDISSLSQVQHSIRWVMQSDVWC